MNMFIDGFLTGLGYFWYILCALSGIGLGIGAIVYFVGKAYDLLGSGK